MNALSGRSAPRFTETASFSDVGDVAIPSATAGMPAVFQPYDEDSRGFLRGFVVGTPGHSRNWTPLELAHVGVKLARADVRDASAALVKARHMLARAELDERLDPIPFPAGRGPALEARRTLARLTVELRRAELRFEQAEEVLRSEEMILEGVVL